MATRRHVLVTLDLTVPGALDPLLKQQGSGMRPGDHLAYHGRKHDEHLVVTGQPRLIT